MIATDMPGLADLIVPRQTGLLVPPKAPDQLAAALAQLFGDDLLARRINASARQAAA